MKVPLTERNLPAGTITKLGNLLIRKALEKKLNKNDMINVTEFNKMVDEFKPILKRDCIVYPLKFTSDKEFAYNAINDFYKKWMGVLKTDIYDSIELNQMIEGINHKSIKDAEYNKSLSLSRIQNTLNAISKKLELPDIDWSLKE